MTDMPAAIVEHAEPDPWAREIAATHPDPRPLPHV